MKTIQSKTGGFSLVEVLAAVAILGIMAFLAIPNIVTMKSDAETNLSIARAEAVNMGMASYIQANGRSAAISGWGSAANDQARYGLVTPYLAFAPLNFSEYMPSTYSLNLPTNITTLSKVGLGGPAGTINY
ncbi:MAG: type II secretion system protein [Verrucomicrobiales bacterium]